MEWQPIETAPDNGIRVLVFVPAFEGEPRVMEARCDMGDWGDPVYGEWNCVPTHWMPLPSPPAAQE